jgi:monoamine oxidase
MNTLHRRSLLKAAALLPIWRLLQPRTHAHAQTQTAQPPSRRSEVIVVGAGAAGLAAAHALTNEGRSVIVLEARQRVGGRVWTDRTWSGIPLDLGASWIHGVDENPLAALVRQYGIKATPTNYNSIAVYDWQGRALSDERLDELDEWLNQMLADADRAGEKLIEDVSLQSALDQLLAKAGVSAEERLYFNYALNTVIEHEFAADANQLSLWHWHDSREVVGGDVLFPGGYDQVLRPWAEALDIRLGEVVQSIQYGRSGVRLRTAKNEYRAEQAIVTLPLGVLKAGSVRFEPALSADKRSALQRMGMGLLNKLYLRFEKPFWDESRDLLGYVSRQRGEWGEWLNLYKLNQKPVLLGFNAGAYARQLEGWNDAKIVSEAMKALRRMYGAATPDPLAWKSTRWAADVWAGGSYSYLALGATPDDYDTLAAPLAGRLFFAGEHTRRDYPSTVHGAVLSGWAAADAVLAGQ